MYVLDKAWHRLSHTFNDYCRGPHFCTNQVNFEVCFLTKGMPQMPSSSSNLDKIVLTATVLFVKRSLNLKWPWQKCKKQFIWNFFDFYQKGTKKELNLKCKSPSCFAEWISIEWSEITALEINRPVNQGSAEFGKLRQAWKISSVRRSWNDFHKSD